MIQMIQMSNFVSESNSAFFLKYYSFKEIQQIQNSRISVYVEGIIRSGLGNRMSLRWELRVGNFLFNQEPKWYFNNWKNQKLLN